MAGLLPDWAFESGAAGGWTYAGGAIRTTNSPVPDAAGYAGRLNHTSQYVPSDPDPEQESTITSGDAAVVHGRTYTLTYKRMHVASGGDTSVHWLNVHVDRGNGAWTLLERVNASALTAALVQTSASFVAAGTVATVRITTESTSPGLANASSLFIVDDFYLSLSAAAMAVRLAERSVDAVVGMLQTYLGTELAAIDTDRNDGITLDVPAAADYYPYANPEIAGGGAFVEVFEDPETVFRHPYTDSDAQRAVYDLTVFVRLTYRNTAANLSRAQMWDVARRYASALKIVLLKYPTLDDADDATQIAALEAVANEFPTADQVGQVVVTARLMVRNEEVV